VKITWAVAGIALLCSGCAVTGYKPPALGGEVLDIATNAPLPNAQIVVESFWHPEETLRATSDSTGKFFIPRASWYKWRLPDLSYAWTDARVIASAGEYQTGETTVLDIAGDEVRGVNIYLTRR
jgi:hypothetical protein